MANTKIYSNKGQKVKELSGPTIRGNKYPKGTIVTNDPNDPRLKAYRDSLYLSNETEKAIGKYSGTDKSNRVYQVDENATYKNKTRTWMDSKGYILQNYNPNIKPVKYAIDGNGTVLTPVFLKPTQPVVFEERITPMNPKGLPTPTIIPNERIQPDVIYKDNNIPNAAYNKGMDIYHRTDGLGRWVAELSMSTQPGIRGRISAPNPKGNYTMIYKYKQQR